MNIAHDFLGMYSFGNLKSGRNRHNSHQKKLAYKNRIKKRRVKKGYK